MNAAQVSEWVTVAGVSTCPHGPRHGVVGGLWGTQAQGSTGGLCRAGALGVLPSGIGTQLWKWTGKSMGEGGSRKGAAHCQDGTGQPHQPLRLKSPLKLES